jgi:hypothetical protein
VRPGRSGCRWRVAELVEDERWNVELAVQHQPDRRYQRVLARRFRHVAKRSFGERAACVARVLRGGQHDDGHIGAHAAELRDRLHPAHSRHHQVEHDDVEIGPLGSEPEGTRHVALLVDDSIRAGLHEQCGNALAQYRVIVHNQHVHRASIVPIGGGRQGVEGLGSGRLVLRQSRDNCPIYRESGRCYL